MSRYAESAPDLCRNCERVIVSIEEFGWVHDYSGVAPCSPWERWRAEPQTKGEGEHVEDGGKPSESGDR